MISNQDRFSVGSIDMKLFKELEKLKNQKELTEYYIKNIGSNGDIPYGMNTLMLTSFLQKSSNYLPIEVNSILHILNTYRIDIYNEYSDICINKTINCFFRLNKDGLTYILEYMKNVYLYNLKQHKNASKLIYCLTNTNFLNIKQHSEIYENLKNTFRDMYFDKEYDLISYDSFYKTINFTLKDMLFEGNNEALKISLKFLRQFNINNIDNYSIEMKDLIKYKENNYTINNEVIKYKIDKLKKQVLYLMYLMDEYDIQQKAIIMYSYRTI